MEPTLRPTWIPWAATVHGAIVARSVPLVCGPRWYGKETVVRDVAQQMGATVSLVTDVEAGPPKASAGPTLIVVPNVEALPQRALRALDQWSLAASTQQPPPPWDRATLVLLSNLSWRDFQEYNPYAFQRVTQILATAAQAANLTMAANVLHGNCPPAMISQLLFRTGGHPYLALRLLTAAAAGAKIDVKLERDRCAPFFHALTQGPLSEPGVRAIVRDLATGHAVTPTRAQWRDLRSWGIVDGTAHRPRLQPPLVAEWARTLD